MSKIKYSVALEKLLKDSNVTVGEISNHECYDTNFPYNTGASKFAILDDCFDNNVIKIPFSYDDEAEYECNASQSFVNQCDCCCDECEYGCLNDLLQDYCLLETEVYEKAEEAGLDFLFAKEELLLDNHKGAVVETAAVSELLKKRYNDAKKANLTYYRDKNVTP